MSTYILQHCRSTGILVVLLLLDCLLPVVAKSDLVVTPTGGFHIMPGVAVVDQSIATIKIHSSEDFSISLKDNTNGVLKNGQNVMRYTVSYDQGPQITLSTSPTTVESAINDGDGHPDRMLTIFVPGAESVGIPAGFYSVTVTAEITAM